MERSDAGIRTGIDAGKKENPAGVGGRRENTLVRESPVFHRSRCLLGTIPEIPFLPPLPP